MKLKIKKPDGANTRINVISTRDGLYLDLDHGFLIRIAPDGMPIVIAIEENGIRRSLTDLEKETVRNLGMGIQH